MKSVAWRSPSVTVPVLSAQHVRSPAASTARPDMAITFFAIMRPMPAMPIAEQSADGRRDQADEQRDEVDHHAALLGCLDA